jgi:hypothetical protein
MDAFENPKKEDHEPHTKDKNQKPQQRSKNYAGIKIVSNEEDLLDVDLAVTDSTSKREHGKLPPAHGYPPTNKPFEENFIPPDALKVEILGIVYNAIGEPVPVKILFDTGSSSNFAPKENIKRKGLTVQPLLDRDLKEYDGIEGKGIMPTEFFRHNLTIRDLELVTDVSVRLIEGDSVGAGIDILLGKAFILQHNILEALVQRKKTQSGNMAMVIFQRPASKGKDPNPIEPLTCC